MEERNPMTEVEKLKLQLRDEKLLREHDAIDARGRLRRLLLHYAFLLKDAREALEFDPPRTKSAKQTLDLVLAWIEKETE